MKQPHVYTLPERFIKDPAVPLRWKLYTIINGFWISGKPVFASNRFFAEKLNCSERQVRECLLDLEKMYLITRHGSSQNRRIIPGGHGQRPDEDEGGTQTAAQGGDQTAVRAAPSVPHISDSISDSIPGALEDELRVEKVYESEEGAPSRKKPKYPNAKTVFSWFPFQEKSWALNTTELKHAELLFSRGEEAVRGILGFLAKNEGMDFLPEVTKPSDLERKWSAIVKFAERNGL